VLCLSSTSTYTEVKSPKFSNAMICRQWSENWFESCEPQYISIYSYSVCLLVFTITILTSFVHKSIFFRRWFCITYSNFVANQPFGRWSIVRRNVTRMSRETLYVYIQDENFSKVINGVRCVDESFSATT